MDLRSLSSVTDFFVVCTAGSTPQSNALKDHIDATLARHGASVWHTEGILPSGAPGGPREPQWVLMDCGDIVVHLLDETARAFYQLEQLWADAPRLSLESTPGPARPAPVRVRDSTPTSRSPGS